MINKKTLLVGTYANGGIKTVIDTLNISNLIEEYHFQASYIEISTLKNWLRFLFYYLFVYFFTLLFNRNIKIVHILCADSGSFLRKAFLLFIAKVFRKKVIFNIHTGYSNLFYKDSVWPVNIFIKLVLDNADMIVVLSEQWKKAIKAKCFNKNIRVVYNPIIMKQPVNNDSIPVQVLFMGRMGKRKGAYDLIEAAECLKDCNVLINMYGDGEVNEIKANIKRKELENIVNAVGWISGDDVKNAYKNADIFILPSYEEGLPMSILEAMSFGLPVISTPVGGIPEQIEDGVNGFLIEPGNSQNMASKIKILADDEKLRKKMGEESYKIAQKKFDVNEIAENFRLLYNELTN